MFASPALRFVRPSYMPKWAPPPTCVLWLPGQDDAYSATIRDRSGYGNNGAITGATWEMNAQGVWTIRYDGTDDYVRVTSPAGMVWGTGDFTCVTWINVTDYANPQAETTTHITMAHTPENSAAWGLYFYTDDHATVENRRTVAFLARAANGDGKISKTAALAELTWYLVAGKRVSGTVTTSLNGGAFGGPITGATMDYSAPDNVDLGRAPDDTTNDFYGKQAISRVLSGGLSDTQIASIFSQERHLFGV